MARGICSETYAFSLTIYLGDQENHFGFPAFSHRPVFAPLSHQRRRRTERRTASPSSGGRTRSSKKTLGREQMDIEEATLLLDLDDDLLLFVVEASGARGQGVWKGVCKLLALLVEEVEKTTPFFASASIEGDEDFATTAMCANAATS